MKSSAIKDIERRLRQLEFERSPAPMVKLTLRDGTQTEPMIWTDAVKTVLDGGAVACECENEDYQALIAAML